MRNLFIFFSLAVVGVYSKQEIIHRSDATSCAKKYNVSVDVFYMALSNTFTLESMKDVNGTALFCMGGCYVKKALNFFFLPDIAVDLMTMNLDKTSLATKGFKEEVRKCGDEAYQSDCDFARCYIRNVIGFFVLTVVEETINAWVASFKFNKKHNGTSVMSENSKINKDNKRL